MSKFLRRIPWKWVAIGGGILAVVATLVLIFIPKERELTITDKTWERKVVVEEYCTVEEDDWHIPTGGRELYHYQSIYGYEPVFDHYEYVEKSRLVPDGYHEEVVGCRDNGDGTFTEVIKNVQDFKTEYYTEREAIYRQEPIYRTKYHYEIERWVFDHYETTSGHTDTPYFATPDLAEKFRTNGTKEEYTVTAFINRDDSKTGVYTLSFEDWSSVNINQTIRAKVHVGNYIELIPDE